VNKQEFEAQYAATSNVTVEQLHAWGRFAAPCDCGLPECHGWQMQHRDDKDWYEAFTEGVCELFGKRWPQPLTEEEEAGAERYADERAIRPLGERS